MPLGHTDKGYLTRMVNCAYRSIVIKSLFAADRLTSYSVCAGGKFCGDSNCVTCDFFGKDMTSRSVTLLIIDLL